MAEQAEWEDHSVESGNASTNGSDQEEEGLDMDLMLGQANDDGNVGLAYRFEPLAQLDLVAADEQAEAEVQQEELDDDRANRVGNVDWCICNHCAPMPNGRESLCCREIPDVAAVIDTLPANHPSQPIQCICQHPGFEPCVINQWVLQVAYLQFRQEYGPLHCTRNRQFRYVGYRQLTRWCWGILGRKIRVILPACAVSRILQEYPLEAGEVRVGYEDP